MAERFFAQLPNAVEIVELRGQEAHHLAIVMRKQSGDGVELFDGAGTVAQTRVLSASKKLVELEVQQRSYTERPAFQLTLATAIPKGDRFKSLVEKATEIGVSRIIPLRTERSIVHPSDSKLAKSQQTVIEACKQCRRNWIMEIEPQCSIDQLSARTDLLDDSIKLVSDPRGRSVSKTASAFGGATKAIAVIGPEGGLSDREVETLESHGFQRCGLGANILRIETAGLVLSAILLHR